MAPKKSFRGESPTTGNRREKFINWLKIISYVNAALAMVQFVSSTTFLTLAISKETNFSEKPLFFACVSVSNIVHYLAAGLLISGTIKAMSVMVYSYLVINACWILVLGLIILLFSVVRRIDDIASILTFGFYGLISLGVEAGVYYMLHVLSKDKKALPAAMRPTYNILLKTGNKVDKPMRFGPGPGADKETTEDIRTILFHESVRE